MNDATGTSTGFPPGIRGDAARLFSAHGTHGGRPSPLLALQRIVTRPSPLAIALYRLSHRLWKANLVTPAEVLWRVNLFLTGADIHPGAEIGGGLRLTHTSGLVVGSGARIGSNVTLLHGVTLGGRRAASSRRRTLPTASPDGSKIVAGAKLLGPIEIGAGSFIGANAVVAKDLPPGSVFNPGRYVADMRRRLEALEAEVRVLKDLLEERPAVTDE